MVGCSCILYFVKVLHMPKPQEKTTYTLFEAAKLLSCHKETLRRAIHGGELKAAKLGREFRISRVDLEDFWASCGGGTLFTTPAEVNTIISLQEKNVVKKKKISQGSCQLSLLSSKEEE